MTFLTILLLALFTTNSTSKSELTILDELKQENKVDDEEYNFFKKQLNFKNSIGFTQRQDSLNDWSLDIVYTEEIYFHKKDSFLIKEYYFSQEKLASFRNEGKIYRPERYYENGALKSKYFFYDKEGKEHLQSILNHMSDKKVIDDIDPIVKVEVVHAGCGFSAKSVEMAEGKTKRKYRKAKKPNYYMIETFKGPNNNKVTFQRPVKTKFKTIVEGHSF